MNELKNRKSRESGKQVPGCMGRMVNLFDFGMAGNKLLAEKAHRDGTMLQGRKDVTKKVSDPVRAPMDDHPVEYELKRSLSNKRSNGTPVKMLIAQEMSKETESKQKPPTVVAKLMGLDNLPSPDPTAAMPQALRDKYLQNASMKPLSVARHEHEIRCKGDIHPSQAHKQEHTAYKDVYEVSQQASKVSPSRDQSLHMGGHNDDLIENKMALVRQKFLEAKRLATDEKLRQSKEFQDALEVLSSNRDLFLKFLQEPNSLFSKHFCELQSNSLPSQAKHITVLKPSKLVETDRTTGVDAKSEKQTKKHQVAEAKGWDSYRASWGSAFEQYGSETVCQPTRIVVLKPSLGKTHEIKAVVSSANSSPRFAQNRDLCADSDAGSMRESREIAKEITRQMRESLSSERRDESLLSSILSNGYVGDESSFNRSENGFIEDGNISDIESSSPISRRSWEGSNMYNGPCSSSSFSRASSSAESSLTREAKKRLSERWALMSSTGSNQEQRHLRRSSSTLGEMLTLSEMKKPITCGEEIDDGEPCVSSSWLCHGDQLRRPVPCLSINGDNPTILSRSRSVPTSSTAFEAESRADVLGSDTGKSITQNELVKPMVGKLSFKGKVSSLFFSGNKKPSKEKHSHPSAGYPEANIGNMAEMSASLKQPSIENRSCDVPDCIASTACEESYSIYPGVSSWKTSSPCILAEARDRTFRSEGSLSLAKTGAPESSSESQDQPSPISVLEASFEEDTNTTKNIKMGGRGLSKHLHCCESDSPIDAATRSFSWDDGSLERIMQSPLETPATTASMGESDKKERLLFVQSLLSDAGLDQGSPDRHRILHSSVCPLNPLLLDKYINGKDYEQQHNEAKRRQWRSIRRLLFDCVNDMLMDFARCPSSRSPLCRQFVSQAATPVAEEICSRVNEWISGNPSPPQSCGETDATMQVERVVRKELAVGREWAEELGLEIDKIGEEIESRLVIELVQEAVMAVAF